MLFFYDIKIIMKFLISEHIFEEKNLLNILLKESLPKVFKLNQDDIFLPFAIFSHIVLPFDIKIFLVDLVVIRDTKMG